MVTSLLRKSITDLSRRRSRTFFAVLTLALAVAGIGLFATPALMNRAMSRRGRGRPAARPDDLHPPAGARPGPAGRAGRGAECPRGRTAVVLRRPGVRRRTPRVRPGARDTGLRQPAGERRACRLGRRAGNGRGPDRRAEHQAGAAVGARRADRADHRRGRGRALAAGQRRGPQPRRRPDRHLRRRDRAVRHAGDRGVAEPDPRLRRAVLPPSPIPARPRSTRRSRRSAARSPRSPASPVSATCRRYGPRATGPASPASRTSPSSSTSSPCSRCCPRSC